ncbi:thiolase-like protein [Mycena belliarum]|uniref:Thiolase-like protein n=1 Tax=Mycena belliarum TaxID=1033014 RepID=A0AAD6TW98_9AGAR|nr:thiolase-like protein [Mycena belliae]
MDKASCSYSALANSELENFVDNKLTHQQFKQQTTQLQASTCSNYIQVPGTLCTSRARWARTHGAAGPEATRLASELGSVGGRRDVCVARSAEASAVDIKRSHSELTELTQSCGMLAPNCEPGACGSESYVLFGSAPLVGRVPMYVGPALGAPGLLISGEGGSTKYYKSGPGSWHSNDSQEQDLYRPGTTEVYEGQALPKKEKKMPSPALKITGFGVAYPPNPTPSGDLDKLAYKWHEPSPALAKVLAINKHTEAGLSADAITHVVATTCTNSSNPGYDSFLAQDLGLRPGVEKVLLHGVGCAGGLAALRLAASLCQAAACRGEPAHVLVVACEITSLTGREELELISREQEVRIGITLFTDGASALVLSLDAAHLKGIFELVNWTHLTVPDTYADLAFSLSAKGFMPTLSARIPSLTAPCAPLLLETLLRTLPDGRAAFPTLRSNAADFDWAVHPGGAAILTAIQAVMKLDQEHMRASWEVYENHGNTSSVTILSVLDTVRRDPGREWVMGVAFGPGICAEGVLLRRI